MNEKLSLNELMELMLIETDKIAMLEVKYGTPEYNLQQSLIRNAARYRLSLHRKKDISKSEED